MRWHELIFSEERKYKVLRHFLFWSSWWLYFLLCFFIYQQPITGRIRPYYLAPGDHLALKTFLLVILYALACYPLLYVILPKIIKGRWLESTGYFIVLSLFLYLATQFLYWNVFSAIDAFFNTTQTDKILSRPWPGINLGIMNFLKVATAAAIIKYLKYWWMKQKESQRLEKEKINAELQLLKAQVHPDFLFKTLNNIYDHALSSSPLTSGMLLKLSDLLSYMLYECDRSTVPLEKELAMMKEYMQLEKIRYNNEPEIELTSKGDLTGKKIAPFLLLPFIENSFKHGAYVTEQFWINMDISVDDNNFSMKLTNGISENMTNQALWSSQGLADVQKRLRLLYPGSHELKMTTEQEMSIVLLNIRLEDIVQIGIDEDYNDEMITENAGTMMANFKYATV